MELIYYKCPGGNFGDDLNVWFWDEVLPGFRDWDRDAYLVGIGSILNRALLPPGRKLVIGTGSGYGELPDIGGPDWDIRGVRGPLTCERLGLPADRSLSDPAILLPTIGAFKDVPKTGEVLFVPHIGSIDFCNWPRLCSLHGIAYQPPSADFMDVIARIAGADRVIAESMHAAIIADAFGVPWRAVSISGSFNLFKWRDWASSLDMHDLKPQQFFAPLRWVRDTGQACKALLRSPKGSTQLGVAGSQIVVTASQAAEARVKAGPPSRHKPHLEPFASVELRRARDGTFRLTDRAALRRQQDKLLYAMEAARRDYAPAA